jgi:rod shape determining protein RodA
VSAVTPFRRREEAATETVRAPPLGIDPLLTLAVLALVALSVVTLHGAVSSTFYEHQAIFAVVGLVLMLAISRFDYSYLRRYRHVFYGAVIFLNVLVFAFHTNVGAANGTSATARFIPLPFFQFQPSELGKLLLIVALAGFMVERSRRMFERRTTAVILLLALIPAMIVIKQPDLGTGLVYVMIAVAVLFFAGTSWKQLTALAALFLVAVVLVATVAPALGVSVLQGYQKQRLTTFLNPPATCGNNDPTCYQLNQSLIAIGSGGKTGRGTAGATQAQLNFIPNDQDDFIFSVVGETYGFAGAALVLSLYALLIWRTLRILTMAKNLFGTLIAGGILAMVMFQVFLNVGMTVGIMPVTGVPLPLLSYGGSSMLITFMAIGLLQSIYAQARIASASKARVSVA